MHISLIYEPIYKKSKVDIHYDAWNTGSKLQGSPGSQDYDILDSNSMVTYFQTKHGFRTYLNEVHIAKKYILIIRNVLQIVTRYGNVTVAVTLL